MHVARGAAAVHHDVWNPKPGYLDAARSLEKMTRHQWAAVLHATT